MSVNSDGGDGGAHNGEGLKGGDDANKDEGV